MSHAGERSLQTLRVLSWVLGVPRLSPQAVDAANVMTDHGQGTHGSVGFGTQVARLSLCQSTW